MKKAHACQSIPGGVLVFLLSLAGEADAGEFRVHAAEHLLGSHVLIQSKGWQPKPSLDVAREYAPSFADGVLPTNLEISSDLSRQWHAYADHVVVARDGEGVVRVQKNLIGIFPLVIGIPAEFDLKLRTLLFGAGYRLGGTQDFDWGVLAGLQHLRGNISATPTEGPDRREQEGSGRITLPTIGVFWRGRLNGIFSAYARYTGTLCDIHVASHDYRADHLRLGLEARMQDRVSVGVGYVYSGVGYGIHKTSYRSRYESSVALASTYVKIDF